MTYLNYTNVGMIAAFEEDLAMYEAAIKPNSGHFHDFHYPAEIMRSALLRIVHASPADTHSMMRRLVAHIAGKVDSEYSDYAVAMLSAGTKDLRAKQLILNILYVTRELVVGERVELTESWLQLIDRNMAIFIFLKNYAKSDQAVIEDTYSGNVVVPGKDIVKITNSDSTYHLVIGYANYELTLDNGNIQTVDFGVSSDIHRQANADPTKDLVIATEVIITPTCGRVVIGSSVTFLDDAIAQISVLGCSPQSHSPGIPTTFILPGLFYSLALHLVSYDSGKKWKICEVNILPPSITRQL